MSSNSTEDNGWEVYGKKSKNKAGSSGAKQFVPQISPAVPTGNTRGMLGHKTGTNGGSGRGSVSSIDSRRPSGVPMGRGNVRYPPVMAPPALQPGRTWSTLVAPTRSTEDDPRKIANNQSRPAAEDIQTVKNGGEEEEEEVEEDEDEDLLDDSDEDLLSGGFDSDASQKSHETRKKSRWFKKFFVSIESLPVDDLNNPERQWHCPACKGGPGAIEWFRGLQPLMAHAKTLRSKRVNLHREFAKLLEEELTLRGTSIVPAGEAFGKWNGLKEKDFEIVWPPMVIIMNTKLDKDDNDKWTGMGNQELIGSFPEYAVVRARHSYGPQGHRGMSVLIFETSAVGYLEAERLSKHFADNGRDREAWQGNPTLFYPGGKRQLYGYMATKKDLDFFNQHSYGKTKLKFEIRSHVEMVVNPMKQMSEEIQQLNWYKEKAEKHLKHVKALEESAVVMGEKYRQSTQETKVVRSKMKMHHEQDKEEKDYLEEFFKEQLHAKIGEDDHHANPSLAVDDNQRAERLEKYFKFLDINKGEFTEVKQKLMKAHDDWVNEIRQKHCAEEEEMKRRHQADEFAAEEVLNTALTKLMEKCGPLTEN